MELNGEEKRIQALFHELRSHDERIAPSFARTWNIAQGRLGRSQAGFQISNLRFEIQKSLLTLPALLSAAVLMCVLGVAIFLWSVHLRPVQHAQTNTQFRNDADVVFKPTAVAKSGDPNPVKPKAKRRNDSIRLRTMATKRTIARPGLRKIQSSDLSRWQSPTAGLLRFPGDELLRTGPAVIQSAPELRTFLSHVN
ncbi:MAG TPA: hypothetical protein VJM12_08915 [Pyrinomonadaceae bacterium]|nr:hypothetical protein [Pyrinomonadaceae bacterium]